MVLRLDDKKTVVNTVQQMASLSVSLITAEYSGLTVSEFTQFRQAARKTNVDVCVVKNTLAKRALENTAFACIKDQLVGPLVLIFSKEDPGAGARLLKSFSKEHEKLKVMALVLGGQLLPKEKLSHVASLPTKQEALSMLARVMIAPVTQCARVIAAPYVKLVRTIAAVRDQKQSGT